MQRKAHKGQRAEGRGLRLTCMHVHVHVASTSAAEDEKPVSCRGLNEYRSSALGVQSTASKTQVFESNQHVVEHDDAIVEKHEVIVAGSCAVVIEPVTSALRSALRAHRGD